MKRILSLLFLLVIAISIFSMPILAAEGEDALSENTTFFEDAYNQILAHSDKILSALAFLASLFLAFAYRKGILPLIKGGLGALSATVNKLKEETERAGEISEQAIKEAKDKLVLTEEVLAELTEKLNVLEKELVKATEEQSKANDVRLVLQSQTELLYEIFMSSSIPMYLKESVGEKVNAMKKRLADSEVSSDD